MRGLVGILGGTFNPIHYGHLLLASFAYEEFNLSKVIFIPNRHPPHKHLEDMAPPEDRLRMVQLAIKDDDRFQVSDIEISQDRVSYTYHTLLQLKERYPRLAFICGKDTLLKSRWYRLRDILEELELLIVADRLTPLRVGGIELYEPPEDLYQSFRRHPILGSYLEKIRLLQMPLIDISSTMIRERIKRGLSIRYLLPPEVEAYIRARGLYRDLSAVRGEGG